MSEIKIFVEIQPDIQDKVVICQANANKLGVTNGSQVEVYFPDNGKYKNAIVEISDLVLDFAGQVAKNIIDELQFVGIELIIRPAAVGATMMPTTQTLQAPIPQIPKVQTQPLAQPTPVPTPQPSYTPQPTPQPAYTPQPVPTPQPSYTPQPTPAPVLSPLPSRPPTMASSPGVMPQPTPSMHPPPGTLPQPTPISTAPSTAAPAAPLVTYDNKIDVNTLSKQKKGIILSPIIDNTIEEGRVQISTANLQKLGLGQGMLIAWEDPLTRAPGSARVDPASISDTTMKMSQDTKEDTNIKSDQIVIFSTEPPIQKASEVMLEVESRAGLMGYCLVGPRIQHTLSIQKDDVLAFEDELTGAIGAGKVEIVEEVRENSIVIDAEILEASGIGSFEVRVSKNQRQIIPLQSISLGISPISGENLWEIISQARQNVEAMKGWISNYIIFKGIQLRWTDVNIACSILNCVPDLSGDILAQVTENTTLTLSPTGLIPFNAILIIDISRSMMARDVYVTNIAPAIEGIKAAMESREIQDFLQKFKDGINIPRRVSAAFAAVLFLSEKVGRGFGEKVSVIRFADEAQALQFGNKTYMDSASGKKGILEEAARLIVDRIGNAYGQATNMGQAMLKAQEILFEFESVNPDQPTMVVLLTDGTPTDGNDFFEAIKAWADNPNVVIYILGLGNPDRDLMMRAAAMCGGEYFEPQDAGELLIWYSKRARDLTVKLKAHK
jgi:hypothetical protein